MNQLAPTPHFNLKSFMKILFNIPDKQQKKKNHFWIKLL